MDKQQAEQILGLDVAPYTARDLRDAYAKLAVKYHPDAAHASGMDAGIAQEYMTEINVAQQTLKRLFTSGTDAISPGASVSATASGTSASSSPHASTTNTADGNDWAAAYESAKREPFVDPQMFRPKVSDPMSFASDVSAKRKQQKQEKKAQIAQHSLVYRIFAKLPYRLILFVLVCVGFIYFFGGFKIFPEIKGVYDAENAPFGFFMLYFAVIGPIATINLVIPFVTTPLRKLILWIIAKIELLFA